MDEGQAHNTASGSSEDSNQDGLVREAPSEEVASLPAAEEGGQAQAEGLGHPPQQPEQLEQYQHVEQGGDSPPASSLAELLDWNGSTVGNAGEAVLSQPQIDQAAAQKHHAEISVQGEQSSYYWEREDGGEQMQQQQEEEQDAPPFPAEQEQGESEAVMSYWELRNYVDNLYSDTAATATVPTSAAVDAPDTGAEYTTNPMYQQQEEGQDAGGGFSSTVPYQEQAYDNDGLQQTKRMDVHAMEAGVYGQHEQQQTSEPYYYDQTHQQRQLPMHQQQSSSFKTKTTFRPPNIFTSKPSNNKVYVDDSSSYNGSAAAGGAGNDYWQGETLGHQPSSPKVGDEEAVLDEESDDDYKDEGLGDNFDETPWVQPTHERAMIYRENAIFEGGHALLCGKVGLRNLGAGVKLHFNLVKALMVGYLILLLLNVPALLMYSSGSRIKKEERDFLGLYSVTMGNIGTLTTGDFANSYIVNLGPATLTLKQAAGILSAMDLFTCFVFVGLMWYISRGVTNAKKLQNTLTCKDFSVFVTNLPKNVEKEQIIEHFSTLYPLNGPDWKHRKPPGGREKRPVFDTANTGDSRYQGKWVAEVAIARRNGQKLRVFLANEERSRKLKRYRAHMKMHAPDSPWADDVTYSKYEEKHNSLGGEMDTIAEKLNQDKRLTEIERDCVGAFIIFEYPESRRRCLEDYSAMNLRHWCNFPIPLQFHGRRLVIKPAPNCEDVWWENLEVPSSERLYRRCAVNFIMVIVLVLSFTMVILLSQAKSNQKEHTPKFSLCDTEIPALFLGSYANVTNAQSDNLQFLTPDPYACSNCDYDCSAIFASSIYATYTTQDNAMTPVVPYDTSGCSDPCPSPHKPLQCPCADGAAGNTVCSTLACLTPTPGHQCQSFTTLTIGGCYCYDKLNAAAQSSGWLSTISTLSDDTFCQGLMKVVFIGVLLQIVLAVSTLAINAFLTFVIHSLTYYEYNHSSDTEATQLMLKVFISQFINTAVLLLLVYGRLDSDSAIARLVKAAGILNNEYSDFNSAWYAVVGTQLTLTALIAAISPHIIPLLQYFVIQPIQRRRATNDETRRPKFVMQHDLNQLYVGPRFDIVQRSGVLLNILFSSFTFSSGLPIMILFALLSFTMTYIIDRLLLLRYYRRPPLRDERIHRKICNCLPYALLLHLSMAIWMYGADVLGTETINQDITASVTQGASSGQLLGGSTMAAKIGRSNTFPLFLMWLVLVIYIFCKDVLPSYYVAEMVSKVVGLIGSLWSYSHGQSDPKMENGYTKMYELPLPANYGSSGAGKEDPSWGVFTDDGGASVLRKLKNPTGASSPKAKSPNGTGRSTCHRTWEVIKVNGLYSYALDRHPKYREAVMTFLQEFSPGGQHHMNDGKKQGSGKGMKSQQQKRRSII